MSHRISLLSLIENKSAFTNHAQQRIVDCASSFFPNVGSIIVHDNAKNLFKGLSNAFTNSDIVIIGADASLFLSFKRLLLQALSLDGESNSNILGVVSKNNEKVAETLALSHALVPKDSTIFASEDGLFSGFATKSGNQHLIVLPLDPNRIDSIIENGLHSYLKQLVAGSEYPADTTNDDDYAIQAAKALLAANLSVAIASTKTSAFIKSSFKDVINHEKVFRFVDCNEERKNLSQKEFVANLANQAREIGICALGAAISNVFASEKEGGRLFVFVTIADTKRARVAKVFAEPGETPRMLVEAAVDTLLNMLINYTQVGGFEGFPEREEEIPDSSPEEVKNKKKIALKVILSGVVALLLCLVIIFFSARVAIAIRNNSKSGNGAVVIHSLTQTLSDISTSAQHTGIYREIYNNSSTKTFATSETSQPENITVKPLITSTLPLVASTKSIVTTIKPIITTSKPKVTKTKPITKTIKPIVTTAKPKITTTKPISTTSKAPVTTTNPPTTIDLPTTTASPTTTTSTTASQSIGTFSFTVKGYGHGVGMSQQGAKAFATQGKSYQEILLHYYNVNITLQDDVNKPAFVSYDGNEIPLNTYLARTTAAEIGTSTPIEALKAQAVAAYTFAKLNNFKLGHSQHAYSSDFDVEKASNIKTAVAQVAGKYLSYNGAVASTPYFAQSAGKTVSAASVWGSDKYPYLEGGVYSPEVVTPTNATFTTDEIKDLVEKYNNKSISKNNITLSGNPSEWFEIIAADDAGYVEIIRVGDQTMSGNTFRYYLLESGIRSHCFIFSYNSK